MRGWTQTTRSQSKTELEHQVGGRVRLKKRVNFCKRWVTRDHESVHHPVVACRGSQAPLSWRPWCKPRRWTTNQDFLLSRHLRPKNGWIGSQTGLKSTDDHIAPKTTQHAHSPMPVGTKTSRKFWLHITHIHHLSPLIRWDSVAVGTEIAIYAGTGSTSMIGQFVDYFPENLL